MVNWEKEIQDVDNKIIINFIDYNNIKFYTIKDINTYFNDKGNDNYINNKYKKEEINKNKDKNKDKNKNKNKNKDKDKDKDTDNKKYKDILKNLSNYCHIYLKNIQLYFLLSRFIIGYHKYKLTTYLY